tara:strand:- start:855 stop:1067 length:213 start_codon:yes stop_codon:yes gene_type:complete
MHKPIGKQLNLNDRQLRQLKLELEEKSWLYSDSIWKRGLACYGYSILGSLTVIVPFYFLLLIFFAAFGRG